MRRKSFLNRTTRQDQVARARRMTPEQRIEAAAQLSETVKELELEGKRLRATHSQKIRS
jgi:hypothetical protein